MSNLSLSTKIEAHGHTRAAKVSSANVLDVFEYANGKLFWKSSLTGKSRIQGCEAGYVNADGYVIVEVGGKACAAHRIVWLIHTGKWPAGEIDHINGVRHDNRFENLRDVSHETNTENRRKATSSSATGLLGVSLHHDGRYRARIRTKGRLVSLGVFDTAQEAHGAYLDAKRKLHAGCTI